MSVMSVSMVVAAPNQSAAAFQQLTLSVGVGGVGVRYC